MFFQYKPEGSEMVQEFQDDNLTATDADIVDSSSSMLPSPRERRISYPSLHFMTEITGFSPDFDYVWAYDIPPSITSIEWLNR